MSLKIRLSRGGAKKRPFYRIVVADARMPRDGRFVERIGAFDPLKAKDDATRLVVDVEKAKAWLAKGAQPTDRVLRLFDGLGIAKREAHNNPVKALPKKKAQERVAAAAAAAEKAAAAAARPKPRQPDRAMASSARLVRLGVFGAAQGVRGEAAGQVLHRRAEGDRRLRRPDRQERRARVPLRSSVRPLRDDMLVVRLAGVTTRDAAEALTGVEIFARRDQLPPPAADEFYYDDLVGLTAVTTRRRAARPRTGLRNYGAGDILEIAPAAGGETLLLPFSKAVAPEIDFAGGRIVVAPPREIDGEAPPPDASEELAHVGGEVGEADAQRRRRRAGVIAGRRRPGVAGLGRRWSGRAAPCPRSRPAAARRAP